MYYVSGWMSTLSKQKTKKKQKQEVVQKEKKGDSKNIQKLVQRLDELRKKGKYVDVAVCPKCKSPNLRRVKSTSGDIAGHLGGCLLNMNVWIVNGEEDWNSLLLIRNKVGKKLQ